MKRSVVREKSFEFAHRVVGIFKYLQNEKREYVLSKQVLRSGTAVGALVREAEQAESRADFVHKMAIALKEANETEYWMELLVQSDFLDAASVQPVRNNLTELLKLLTSIIKSSKKRSAMDS